MYRKTVLIFMRNLEGEIAIWKPYYVQSGITAYTFVKAHQSLGYKTIFGIKNLQFKNI